jgi:hypothetical protein
MPVPNGFQIIISAFSLLVFSFMQTMALAAEATIHDAGVVFDLPDAWTYKVESTKGPTGQLMQRWVRSPLKTEKGQVTPEMVVLATPVPEDADLGSLTQDVLSKEPYNVTSGSDTECLKCVRYQARLPEGTITAFSFEPPPHCEESDTLDSEAPCRYQKVNLVELGLEPSWAFRMERDMPPGKMTVLFVHAVVAGKLLDITFLYPSESAKSVEQEVMPIIRSMRKR